MADVDFFFNADGSVGHLGIRSDEVFPRILTVGSFSRAEQVAKLFDSDREVKRNLSERNFLIISGYFNSVGISIIAIGMGCPLMDFMIREVSLVKPTPLAIIRLGTCGIFEKQTPPGTVMTCSKGSMFVYTNYIRFDGCLHEENPLENNKILSMNYLMTKPAPCHLPLQMSLIQELKDAQLSTRDGLSACGETFYSCQGRNDPRFTDENDSVFQSLVDAGVSCMDMETHQLFHLASRRKIPCYTAAALVGVVNRVDKAADKATILHSIEDLELKAGRCCLTALAKFVL